MTSKKPEHISTGGPAFSMPGSESNYPCEGASLRAWFAGQAITGVINTCAADLQSGVGGMRPAKYFAMKAYEIADAMLEIEAATEANNSAARDGFEAPY